MKKKTAHLCFAVTLFTSTFLVGGNVFAQTGEQLTDEYEINWEEVWENTENLNASIDFGSVSDPNGITTFAKWGELAEGKTAVSTRSGGVFSKGTTKGKIISTVVSATTSIKNRRLATGNNGPKKTAIGKFTATSEASVNLAGGGVSPYQGVTIHTATDSGVLYESRTAAMNVY
ncbi:hypothetical protein [Bacillus sp. SD088]|uniref:hypothetical protein n=1 Tax=Bacillus sp. SD088 TaxID=2782012 RepID=UPI001A95FA1A|nr:hypothetical protein [Bacillus sp. SD088]MBO0994149.1 hypothetical protein [Bacillus sp. SD088]